MPPTVSLVRYADYDPAKVEQSLTKPAERDVLDLLQEAARTQLYWALCPEADGRWTLRRFDDATGRLGDVEHTSARIGDDLSAAVEWSEDLVDVRRWASMTRPHPGVYVDHLYEVVRDLGRQPRAGRDIVVRIESDPNIPGVPLLTVRERWSATDLESDPLYFCEFSGFDGETDMLRQVGNWFGLSPDGWSTVTPGVEYWHAKITEK
jgi:hypothetical protein